MLTKMPDKPWKINASSYVTINSIFAAFSGVLIPLVFYEKPADYKIISGILFISFVLFALASEMSVGAIDEDDLEKYVYYMIHYNAGVILLMFAMVYLIAIKNFVCFCDSYLGLIGWLLCVIIITMVFSWKWFYALRSLLNKNEFREYLDELDGVRNPSKDYGIFMNNFLKYKKREEVLPHDKVYTRLGCSTLHGVGVFAIKDIPKEMRIFTGDENSMLEFDRSILKDMGEQNKQMYEDFCIFDKLNKGVMRCPANFNKLTVGWYLNHSEKTPNVYYNETEDDFYALRDINKGEELTVNYDTFSELPPGWESFTDKIKGKNEA